jgi:Protein of unknown function (DUF4054)
MDVTQFRLDFPEFADEQVYTDAMCTFWAGIGAQINSPEVFGGAYNQVIELFTAHNLVLQAKAIDTVSVGGIPGRDGGAITDKKTGSVQQQYDSTSSSTVGQGNFNETTYGRQYLYLRKMFWQGAIAVGNGCQSHYCNRPC